MRRKVPGIADLSPDTSSMLPVSQRGVQMCRNCRITNVVEFGIFVRLGPGVSGLLHRSQMDIGGQPVEDYFEVDERVDVEVANVNQDNKISLRLLDDMYDSDDSEQVRVAFSSAGYKG